MECVSDVDIHRYNFKWSIKKFSLQLECAQNEDEHISIQSSSFNIEINGSNTEWYLKLYLYGRLQYRNDFISIFAYCDDFDGKSVIWASKTYYFLNVNGELDEIVRCPFRKFLANDPSWGIEKLYSQKELLDERDTYLPDDTLTIVCQLDLMVEQVMETHEIDAPIVTKCELESDFIKLLCSEEFSDVTLIVCDTNIRAHKAILAARSRVFASMFKFGSDAVDNCVHIIDLDLEIFKIMLVYIYTNKVHDLDNVAMNLLYAADNYGLDHLKEMCEESLHRQVTVLNSVEIFIMAHRFNAKQLIEYTENFIIQNIVDVKKTEGYETMKREHPHISAILCRSLVMKQQNQ